MTRLMMMMVILTVRVMIVVLKAMVRSEKHDQDMQYEKDGCCTFANSLKVLQLFLSSTLPL